MSKAIAQSRENLWPWGTSVYLLFNLNRGTNQIYEELQRFTGTNLIVYAKSRFSGLAISLRYVTSYGIYLKVFIAVFRDCERISDIQIRYFYMILK